MNSLEERILKARRNYLKREMKINIILLVAIFLILLTFILILINVSTQAGESESLSMPNNGLPPEENLSTLEEEEVPPFPSEV